MQNTLSEIEQEAPRANQITAKNCIIRAVVDIRYFPSAPSAPAAKTQVMRCQPVGAFFPGEAIVHPRWC